MGCTVRDKHIRTNRRIRWAQPEYDPSTTINPNSNAENLANANPDTKPPNFQIASNSSNESPNSTPKPNPNPNSVFDDSGWGYCTEEQLEEILLKNLEFLYNEAINKLVALGYDEEVALKAILRDGHCYGASDILTNILHNSLAYLNSGGSGPEGTGEDSDHLFLDLRQLEEYSLAGMVCLLQQVKPNLTKGDAMWCLLMSDLHVGRASVMEIPIPPLSNGNGTPEGGVGNVVGPVGVVPPALCRFHGGWGFGNSGTAEFPANGFLSFSSEMSSSQREIECPKRFNLSPSMKNLLKRNVAMFAAGFRANSKTTPSSLSDTNSSNESRVPVTPPGDNQDVVNSVMSKFRDLNLDESLNQKDEMIVSLVHQIKDLEKQVKERKEWAHQKAMQAATKLSNDLTELKTLRTEREETQRLKKGKQTLEEATMKRLSEMENALRKASGQVDRANAAVRKLEIENAEIRAEMEASKLSASESVRACLEVAKREKKFLKKLLAWEKQKTKMQEDIDKEKGKIADLERELGLVEATTKEAEAKWRNEQKSKDQLLTQLDEERRLKEASEANNKRKIEALRLKIEVDFQRHKDDLQRLEQEYARLKDSSRPADPENRMDPFTKNPDNTTNPQGQTIENLLDELEISPEEEEDTFIDRECMICSKYEVSVVFLPCAHQVICANCDNDYGKKGRAVCLYCRVLIEQRIHVFGAASS